MDVHGLRKIATGSADRLPAARRRMFAAIRLSAVLAVQMCLFGSVTARAESGVAAAGQTAKVQELTETGQTTEVQDGTGLELSAQGQEFLASGREIRIGFYEETEPLAFVREDGTYDGIYIQLLEEIRKQSGLNITFYPISRSEHWSDLIESGLIDFYIGSSEVILQKEGAFCTTEALMEYTNILVTKSDTAFNTLEKPVVALTSGRAYWADYLKNIIGEGMEVKYYRSGRECMLAVVKGEADASLLNNLEFSYHCKNIRFSKLIQWSQYRFLTGVGLTTSAESDKTMFEVVNYAVSRMDEDYRSTVIDEYSCMPYHSYTFLDKLYNARYFIVIGVLLLVMLVIIKVMLSVFRRGQEKIRVANLERERRDLQVLAATSYEYSAIYYIDLDENLSELIHHNTGLNKKRTATIRPYDEALSYFAETYVKEEYWDSILQYTERDAVLNRFQETPHFVVRYQIHSDERKQVNFDMHFVQVEKNSQGHHMMVLGIRCIDDIIREEQEEKRQLQDALEGANRANMAKSEFLSRMSHDIRTPMNIIIGMTAIAGAHIDEKEKVQDSLNKIADASHHLLGLINDVLDMSKIEAGRVTLTEEKVDLKKLLNSLLDMMQEQIKEHHHTLDVDIQNLQNTRVIGDSLRIRQAFINLMSNAVKYTPDGGRIALTVREKPIKTPSVGCYEFVIKDNGIGMTPEVMECIFDPFVRAEDSRTSKILGTGLGLSITRNIVQMMNGSIHVESAPGKGSTFTMMIFLKLQDDEGEAGDTAETEEAEGIATLQSMSECDFSGHRLLLVEDNELNREIAREILGMVNLEVEEAANGLLAVQKFDASPVGYYDLILMDIQMPVMNGYDATTAIRALERPDAAQIPIIAMTANAFVEDIQRAQSSGMNEHISKPIDVPKLKEVLRAYLSDRKE